MIRGLVFKEGLREGTLPAAVTEQRRYPHLLDRRIPVEVIEFDCPEDRLEGACAALRSALAPRGFYAHLLAGPAMHVVFPHRVVTIAYPREDDVRLAQEAGTQAGVPMRQMRFLEMFTVDHPDA
jgi:hypothetical protein